MRRTSVEIAAQLISVTANLTFGQSRLLIRSQDDYDENDSDVNGSLSNTVSWSSGKFKTDN